MPEKKNNIITFRTTEETREKLEEYANLNKWSISKAIEEIVLEYFGDEMDIERIENIEAKEAAKIVNAIEERKVKTMAELLRYCIENNLYETFMRGNEIYTTILKEFNIEN